jgi:AAHS family 4-hydroxybenzoate transporter-like MFS transporter
VFSLAIAFASTRGELIALRFLAGLGFGGALPNSLALVAEFLPARNRYTIMGFSALGFIGGSALSGWIAIALLPLYGWRSVFVAGGGAAIIVGFAVIAWLPESLRFLAGRDGAEARIAGMLRKIDPRYAIAAGTRFAMRDSSRRGLPMRHLFTEGRAYLTVPVWTAAFFVLLNLYLLVNWIPILTRQQGLAIATGVFIASLFQVGAGFAGVTVGILMDRFNPFHVLASFAAGGALAVIGLGLAGADVQLLMAGTFISGFFIVGCQGCLNLSCATMYPTYARVTGTGWMLGIGRIGSFIGPLVGGTLLGLDWAPASLFYFAAVPMLCVILVATFLMRKAGRFVLRREPRARLVAADTR